MKSIPQARPANLERPTSDRTGWKALGTIVIGVSALGEALNPMHTRSYEIWHLSLIAGVVLMTLRTFYLVPTLLLFLAEALNLRLGARNLPGIILGVCALISLGYFWWTDRKAKGHRKADA